MTEETRNRRRDWKNEKPIGAFCGAFLGLMLVMTPLLFVDNPGLVVIVIAGLVGTVGGIVAGLRFPGIAHGVFGVLDILFHVLRIGP